MQKDSVVAGPRHNSIEPARHHSGGVIENRAKLETPVKYHPPPRNHVQGSAPKERNPSARTYEGNRTPGEGFDVIRSHHAKLDNVNKVIDNNTSLRVFGRHNPVTDGVNSLPDHNQAPVKPYYGGTKTMYERNNSAHYNTKSVMKTGMRHAGAQIMSNQSFDQGYAQAQAQAQGALNSTI